MVFFYVAAQGHFLLLRCFCAFCAMRCGALRPLLRCCLRCSSGDGWSRVLARPPSHKKKLSFFGPPVGLFCYVACALLLRSFCLRLDALRGVFAASSALWLRFFARFPWRRNVGSSPPTCPARGPKPSVWRPSHPGRFFVSVSWLLSLVPLRGSCPR